MKGTPQSLWLSWANRAASQATAFWTGVFAATAQRNQAALMKAMTTPPKPARTRKTKGATQRR